VALFAILSNDKPSVQPPAKRIAGAAIGANGGKIKQKARRMAGLLATMGANIGAPSPLI
jgi:hypothetical protein